MNLITHSGVVAQLRQEAKSKTTRQLFDELSSSLAVTAEYLVRSAVLWVELESRGEDLSHLRQGIMQYLPMVANSTLDPRAIISFAGKKTLLASFARLPLPAQQQVLDNNNIVEVVELEADKTKKVRAVDITTLPAAEVYRVLGDGEIKSPEKQYQALLVRQAYAKKKPKTSKYTRTHKVAVDGDCLIVAGRYAVSLEQVMQVIAGDVQSKKAQLAAQGVALDTA